MRNAGPTVRILPLSAFFPAGREVFVRPAFSQAAALDTRCASIQRAQKGRSQRISAADATALPFGGGGAHGSVIQMSAVNATSARNAQRPVRSRAEVEPDAHDEQAALDQERSGDRVPEPEPHRGPSGPQRQVRTMGDEIEHPDALRTFVSSLESVVAERRALQPPRTAQARARRWMGPSAPRRRSSRFRSASRRAGSSDVT